MPEYCTCGAQLPAEARFCHKCGKPQFDAQAESEPTPVPVIAVPALPRPEAEINFRNPTAVRVSFLAALVTFLVTALPLPPVAAVARLLVCIIAAGFLAVFIYKRRTGRAMSIRAGARLGWMTGIFSFAILMVMATISMVSISMFRDQLRGKDPTMDQVIRMMDDRATMAGMLILTLLLLFVLYTLLPVLGGALGAKVLEKD